MRSGTRKDRQRLGHTILGDLSVRPAEWPGDEVEREQNQLLHKAIRSGNFHDAFVPLKIMRDYYRGIHTTYEKYIKTQDDNGKTVFVRSKDDEDSEDDNGKRVLVRDARAQSESEPEHYKCEANYYKFAQLGLNYLSGLSKLLEIEHQRRTAGGEESFDLEEAKRKLIEYADTYIKDILPEKPNNLEEQQRAEALAEDRFGRLFHDVIKPLYREHRHGLSDNDLTKELKHGRTFANMEVTPYSVATISRHAVRKRYRKQASGKKYLDVVELELPMVELTTEQVRLINNRLNEAWYKEQNPTIKKLIDRYADKIKAGAMVPAQLIHHLIGTRNGYEKWTAILEEYDKSAATYSDFKVINKAYHSGTQANLFHTSTPDTQTQATIETIEQLEELTDTADDNGQLFVNSLVTPLPLRSVVRKVAGGSSSHEIDVINQINAASESEGIQYFNTPLNFMRRLIRPRLDGVKALLKAAIELRDSKTLNRDDKKNLIKQIKKLEEALKETSLFSFFSSKRQNLAIATQANLLVHTLNELDRGTRYALISACFSGQDRGGLLSTNTSNEAVVDHLTAKRTNKKAIAAQRQRVIDTQAFAGHTSEMAGNAGTGFGGEGLKPGTKDAMSVLYSKAKKYLLSKTAGYNEHTPPKPHVAKRSFISRVFLFIRKKNLSWKDTRYKSVSIGKSPYSKPEAKAKRIAPVAAPLRRPTTSKKKALHTETLPLRHHHRKKSPPKAAPLRRPNSKRELGGRIVEKENATKDPRSTAQKRSQDKRDKKSRRALRKLTGNNGFLGRSRGLPASGGPEKETPVIQRRSSYFSE